VEVGCYVALHLLPKPGASRGERATLRSKKEFLMARKKTGYVRSKMRAWSAQNNPSKIKRDDWSDWTPPDPFAGWTARRATKLEEQAWWFPKGGPAGSWWIVMVPGKKGDSPNRLAVQAHTKEEAFKRVWEEKNGLARSRDW